MPSADEMIPLCAFLQQQQNIFNIILRLKSILCVTMKVIKDEKVVK